MSDTNSGHASERTTGNEPVEGLDPGGTHSTHPGKSGPDGTRVVEEHVETGDQHDVPNRA